MLFIMKKILGFVVISLLLSSNVYSKTIVVKANPEKGFHFPYLLKTSKKTVDANYIVVESNNTGDNNSIKGMTSKAKKSLSLSPNISIFTNATIVILVK